MLVTVGLSSEGPEIPNSAPFPVAYFEQPAEQTSKLQSIKDAMASRDVT